MFILIQEAVGWGLTEKTIDLNYWSSHDAIRQVLNKLILDNNYRKRILEITAIVNELADELLQNVQRMIIKNGLDPVDIPDQNLENSAGTVYLKKGRLENVSNIKRYNDVTINYRVSKKKVTFSLPIKYDILKFVYQYDTIMWYLTAKGEVQANLKNMKAKIIISFDFEKCVVSLDQFNITDQGQLNVSFPGCGFLNWIFGLSSTSSMHCSMIQDIRNTVTEELEKIVAKINSALKFILQE